MGRGRPKEAGLNLSGLDSSTGQSTKASQCGGHVASWPGKITTLALGSRGLTDGGKLGGCYTMNVRVPPPNSYMKP